MIAFDNMEERDQASYEKAANVHLEQILPSSEAYEHHMYDVPMPLSGDTIKAYRDFDKTSEVCIKSRGWKENQR